MKDNINRQGRVRMKKIIISGIGGPAGRATASFFKTRGHIVIGTDIVPTDTLVDGFHYVPRGGDQDFDAVILELMRREQPDLFIPTVSEELPRVARIKEQILLCGTKLFISSPSAVDVANDKYDTAVYLRNSSLAAPRTVLPADVRDVAEIGALFGYPFLAKPRIGRGGRGVTIIRCEEEARKELRRDIVFQEFMPGEEYDVNLFAYPAGHTTSVAVLLKTELKNGIVGNAMSVRRIVERNVASLAIATVRKLQLEGPIDMDIRKDHLGDPRILEINARVGANVLSACEILEEMSTLTMERSVSNVSAHGSFT